MTIEILIKLLNMSIVANRILGSFFKCKTLLLFAISSSLSSSTSEGDKEKYATSEPDIRAEQMIRTNNNKITNDICQISAIKKKNMLSAYTEGGGSDSNGRVFVRPNHDVIHLKR